MEENFYFHKRTRDSGSNLIVLIAHFSHGSGKWISHFFMSKAWTRGMINVPGNDSQTSSEVILCHSQGQALKSTLRRSLGLERPGKNLKDLILFPFATFFCVQFFLQRSNLSEAALECASPGAEPVFTWNSLEMCFHHFEAGNGAVLISASQKKGLLANFGSLACKCAKVRSKIRFVQGLLLTAPLQAVVQLQLHFTLQNKIFPPIVDDYKAVHVIQTSSNLNLMFDLHSCSCWIASFYYG